jgi:transposase
VHQHTLDHQKDDVRDFYAQFVVPAVVGLEATGYARWFHRLLESLGHHLLVGDAYVIRKCALRRQKNDRRDAELLVDLLLHGDFPAVHIPPIASQAVLRLLRYRQRLVEIQTKLRNGLQALALNHQLRLGPKLWSKPGQQQLRGGWPAGISSAGGPQTRGRDGFGCRIPCGFQGCGFRVTFMHA